MNEPLAALVAAAKALDRAYGAIPAGGLSPLTPERAQAWADLQDALAAIPPGAVLVTEAELAFLRREAHSFDECRRRVTEARISADRAGYPTW